MKKILLSATIVSLLAVSAFAVTNMCVEQTGAPTLRYDVDNVEKVYYEKKNSSNFEMCVWQKDGFVLRHNVENIKQVTYEELEETQEEQGVTVSGMVGSHSYVDLGLPDGTLWANYNVGATKVAEYGDYFAWGETEPKEVYNKETYKWGKFDSGDFKLTKYNTDSYDGDKDDKTILDAEDDAATVNWGLGWKIPSPKEVKTLIDGCNWESTEDFNGTGIAGRIGTSKKNGNKIFLPYGGYRSDSSLFSASYIKKYWTSSVYHEKDYYDENYEHYYNYDAFDWGLYSCLRYFGYNVRAIVSDAIKREYTVEFFLPDGTLIESKQVVEGKAARINAPLLEGFKFVRWEDSSFISVKENLKIYALYEELENPITTSGEIGGYSYVDLGLSVQWATYNVGATRPAEFGYLYAWGELSPRKEDGEYVEYQLSPGETVQTFEPQWDIYKWCKGTDKSMTKYCREEEYGDVDGKSVLEAGDDVATVNWGGFWRMPTQEEWTELVKGCTWEWTEDFYGTGEAGAIGTSKVNGNKIFFPACNKIGTKLWTELYPRWGEYWSSSLTMFHDNEASFIFFLNDLNKYEPECSSLSGHDRYNVSSIRAVVSEKERKVYTVDFYTSDSVLIERQFVEEGKTSKEVIAPLQEGFKFNGWSDSSFTNVMGNLQIYAQYEKREQLSVTVDGNVDGYSYVDLALPSGTKWATYNVGATKYDEYGDYFAWGDTKSMEVYNWDNYKWCKGNYKSMTKYCTDDYYGTIDNMEVLEPGDDAATANWGTAWRMPVEKEFIELQNECYWQWTDDFNGTGIAGQVGISKRNGNVIFLPAAGERDDNNKYFWNSRGEYWSSSLSSVSNDAIYFYFKNDQIKSSITDRYNGLSIRAVVAQ